jgi:hypothetical protein
VYVGLYGSAGTFRTWLSDHSVAPFVDQTLSSDYGLDALEAEGLGSVPRISLRIDPREARVVAYLCDRNSGAVLASAQCTPTMVAAPILAAPAESTPAPREGGR